MKFIISARKIIFPIYFAYDCKIGIPQESLFFIFYFLTFVSLLICVIAYLHQKVNTSILRGSVFIRTHVTTIPDKQKKLKQLKWMDEKH